MDTIRQGQRIKVTYKGKVHNGVVTFVKHGRRYVHAKVTTSDENCYDLKVASNRWSDMPSWVQLVGAANSNEMNKALSVHAKMLNEAENSKTEVEAGRKADIKKLNLAVGDIVMIRFRGGRVGQRKVAKINFRNGKVGLIMNADSRLNGLSSSVQWIDPAAIVSVEDVQKALPFTLKEKDLNEIALAGWKQFRFGREFIESSYVVGNTRENARRGWNYENAGDQVYKDSTVNMFWRSTGSFD